MAPIRYRTAEIDGLKVSIAKLGVRFDIGNAMPPGD
jgi:hypothetical protein